MAEKIEIQPPTLGVETNPEANFRHSLSSMGWHISNYCHDAECPPEVLFLRLEERMRQIREKYMPVVPAREHG